MGSNQHSRTLKVAPIGSQKKLYFIVPRNSAAEAQRFVEFLRSPQGVKALRETEILPDAE